MPAESRSRRQPGSQRSQPAAFKAQGPRTARGQVKVVRHQNRGEPVAACSRSIRSKTRPAVVSSRSPVGSSASSSRGLLTSARASATRCCSPPESSPGRWAPRSSKPTSLSQFAASCQRLALVHAASQQRHGHVFQRRKLRQQVMKLPDVTDLPVAKGRSLRAGRAGPHWLRRSIQFPRRVHQARPECAKECFFPRRTDPRWPPFRRAQLRG